MLSLRDNGPEDASWITEESKALGGPVVACNGSLVDLRAHPARIAVRDGARAGFAVHAKGSQVELLAIRALIPGQGVGTALVEDLVAIAKDEGARSIAVETTNDNLDALRFYQRRGFHLTDCRIGGFADVRRLKGLDRDVPYLGVGGVEIRDIFRLERRL